MTAAAQGERYLSMDAVRGFAVLGILLMNIVGMGLPAFAYIDPTFYGGSTGPDLWTWAINFVFTDGKMRGLFTILFGASMVLIADRAEKGPIGPNQTHYRRMLWLFLFGMVHAYLLWWGDILVCYAVAGSVAFLFRKIGPRTLIGIGVVMLAGVVVKGLIETSQMATLRDAATAPGASAETLKAWAQASFLLGPPHEMANEQVAGFGGGLISALKARAQMAVLMQTVLLFPDSVVEAIGQMLIGMGLFRLGFFTLKWSTKSYLALIALGYLVAAPLTAWMAWKAYAGGFDKLLLHLMGVWSAVPRPFIAVAHASALLLFVRSGAMQWLVNRLAAAGRMALSNYLGTSIVAVLVFDGWAFGLYGQLHRWQLYLVVAGIWAAILAWSKPWMERFHYGPFEWVWRSLVQWKPQPFARGGPKLAPAE